MNLYNFILIILIFFLKTVNVLSKENIFNVNNIEIIKKTNISNKQTANNAIKKGFQELIEKILLDDDKKKLSQMKLSEIRELVSYYQVKTGQTNKKKEEKLIYNISFDKKKIHSLFYEKNILYSEIINKELYILPIYKKEEQIFIYNNNFFYEKWSEIAENKLVEFIIPLENIEVMQKININKNNLFQLNLKDLFEEYLNKNIALIFIEDKSQISKKIYLKTRISNKSIDKNLIIKKDNLSKIDLNEIVIKQVSQEIIDIIKAQNLIDIRTPSFINTKFITNKKNSLVELNKRLKKIDLVNEIYVQEFNKESVLIKIKYLGKLDKIIQQFKDQNIILKFYNEQWSLKII